MCGVVTPPKPIEVTFEGDSLTFGLGDANAHRYPLFQAAQADRSAGAFNVDLRYVGPLSNGWSPTQLNNGVGLSTVPDHTAAAPLVYGPGLLEPAIISVLLGTNDADSALLTANFAANYTALVGALRALVPSVVLVGSFLPPASDATRNARVSTINGLLPGLWTTLSGTGPLFAPTTQAPFVLGPTDYVDGVHLNMNGYRKLTANLYPSFRSAIMAVP